MWTLRRLLGDRRLDLLLPLAAAARDSGQRLYLTGGFLRDRLSGRRPKNEVDLTVALPAEIAAAAGRASGGSPFLLDRERDTWRIVWPGRSALEHADITRLRGATIEIDLGERDFTVNAMAVDVTAGRGRGILIDPLGGRADVEERILRSCGPGSFRDDPLRVLRGYRFSSTAGYRMERRTASRARAAAPALAGIAGERIRLELFSILQGPDAAGGLQALVRDGVLAGLSPAFRKEHPLRLNVTKGCLSLAESFSPRSRLAGKLGMKFEDGVTGKGVLVLAAFLRDRQAAGESASLAESLRLGRRSAELLRTAAAADLPPGLLREKTSPGRETLYGLHRRWGDSLEEVLCLEAVTLLPPPCRKGAVVRVMTSCGRARRHFTAPPILTGRDAMRLFGLPSGKKLGGLLKAARDAQSLGRFRDREGAKQWARRFLSARKGGARARGGSD